MFQTIFLSAFIFLTLSAAASGEVIYKQFEFDGKVVTLPVKIIDGYYVFDDDVSLGKADPQLPPNVAAALVIRKWRRWENGVIPYKIEDGHPLKSTIELAIQTLNAQTVLWYKPWNGDVSTDYITIVNTSRCYTNLAGQPFGDGTVVEISNSCASGGPGVAMHELLHVAGLFHEHQRPDAREYIRLNCFNMDGGCDWNVKQVPFMGAIAKSHGKYNYDSLMHYPCDYNAKNDAIPTIDAATNRIGQRSGLSQGDVDAINAMYYDISPSRGKPNFPAQPLPRLHFNGNCNNVAYNPKMRCKFLREALQDYKAQLVGSLTARNGRESYWRDQVQRVARELQDLDCPTTAMALGKYYANASPGFTPLSVTSELAGYWDSQTWLSADFNGDGKSDLAVVYKADGGKAHVMLFLFDGNSYLNHSTTVLEKFLDGAHWLAGDVNGDGLVDLIHVYGHKEGEIKAHAMVHLSNGNSFEYAFTARLAKFWASQRWVTGDVDGDGKSDLVTIYKGPDNRARAMTFFSSGSGFPREGFTKLAKFWDRQKWMIGDVNADKKADLINLYEGPQGKAHVMFHLGGSEGFSDGGFSILAGYSDSQYWTVGDVNGDGRDDLINVYRGPNKASHVMTHLSSGSEYVYGNTSVLGEHPKKGFWAAARVGPSQVAGLVSVAGW